MAKQFNTPNKNWKVVGSVANLHGQPSDPNPLAFPDAAL